MKKFITIALSAALMGGICQDASAAKLPEILMRTKTMKSQVTKSPAAKKDGRQMYAAKAADAAAVWRAGTQKAFGWNGVEWEMTEVYKIVYDEMGQKTLQTVTDADGYVNREAYTWNDNGQLSTRFVEVDPEGTGEYQDYSRLSRQYDPRVTTFITVNDQQLYNSGNWTPSNSYTQTVSRNDAGNVTQMERAVFFQGVYDPIYRLNITYGEDGKANTIVTTELTYDYETNDYAWVESGKYTDIVWEETNGQIVSIDEDADFFPATTE